MILVTGATGFIGRSLVRELSAAGYPLRTSSALRAAVRGCPGAFRWRWPWPAWRINAACRAALNDVDVIFHLASAESQGSRANLLATDMNGTRNLVEAAADAGVQRFIYVSHIGAARASAYPVFKAKGVAEEHIRHSSIPFTILRSSIVYGPEDHFTTGLARLLRMSPGIFFVPGGGRSVLQPFWVEDLVACLLWSLDSPETVNQVYELGGSEYFTLRQILEILMPIVHARRYLFELPTVMLRYLAVFFESIIPNYPASSFWIDYASISRTCAADSSLPRLRPHAGPLHLPPGLSGLPALVAASVACRLDTP